MEIRLASGIAFFLGEELAKHKYDVKWLIRDFVL